MPLVSITNHQRLPVPPVNWMGTVYHGLPAGQFRQGYGGGDYLAFLGRICPDKGPVEAIDIARRAGMKLKMAAKVDPVDQLYFDDVIRPLLKQSSHVEFIGEISDSQKQVSWATPRRCCFRSAGRNRSAW